MKLIRSQGWYFVRKECAKKKFEFSSMPNSETFATSFPVILILGKPNLKCGGVLITERHVLSGNKTNL